MATKYLERAADFPGSTSDNTGNVTPAFVDSDTEALKTYDRTNSEFRQVEYVPSGAKYATVTQITSISTGVTVSGLGGQITTVASTLAAAAEAEFEVTNDQVAATDVIALSTTYNGAGTPMLSVRKVGAGVFTITITNVHAANALDAVIVINFRVLKAAE